MGQMRPRGCENPSDGTTDREPLGVQVATVQSLILFLYYFFISLEIERARAGNRGRGRERKKQAPCSAQSWTWGSIHDPEIKT